MGYDRGRVTIEMKRTGKIEMGKERVTINYEKRIKVLTKEKLYSLL